MNYIVVSADIYEMESHNDYDVMPCTEIGSDGWFASKQDAEFHASQLNISDGYHSLYYVLSSNEFASLC